MGKRRKTPKKALVQKKKYKVPKFFRCPYCARQDGIKITMNRKMGTADLICRNCGVGSKNIDTSLRLLKDPIDVYDEWMDKAREANQEYNVAQQKNSDNDDDDDYDEISDYSNQRKQTEINDDEEDSEDQHSKPKPNGSPAASESDYSANSDDNSGTDVSLSE